MASAHRYGAFASSVGRRSARGGGSGPGGVASARLDSRLLLIVVVGGDQRLLERFGTKEFFPDDRGKLDGYSRLLPSPRMDGGS